MGQIKKLYQDEGNVEIIVSTEEKAVYPITASSAVYHQGSWGSLGAGQATSNILAALDEGYLYVGMATPNTNPRTYNHKVFYLASEAGTYTHFGGLIVSGLTVLKNSGNGWDKEEFNITGGGGGGDTPVSTGGFIGSTPVRNTSGTQDLTGISNIYLESNARIYFGGSGDVYLEYGVNGFHFSQSVYSDGQVAAGGIGSGSGGGGGDASYSAGDGISISNNTISVKKASSSTLGGIKVGTGLSINSSGVLSVTGGGGGSTVSWGTYSSSAHTVVLTVNGTSYTLCENGYSAGGGVSSESDPIFTAHPAYGITSTKIDNWDAAYGWGNHASAGYLTSQAISTLTLNAGTFTSGSWTPTGSGKSFNIPTTAAHLSYGSGTIKTFLDDLSNNYVTLDTPQEITGAKTFKTNPVSIHSSSAINVDASSYIDIGSARLVYDSGARALHVTIKDGDTVGTPIGLFADGPVSAGGAANQTTISYVTTGSGAQSIAGTKTFTGTLVASGEAQFNNDVTITADDVIINALLTLGGIGISGSSSLLSINKNTKFSGLTNVTGGAITIQQIVDRLVWLENQIQN